MWHRAAQQRLNGICIAPAHIALSSLRGRRIIISVDGARLTARSVKYHGGISDESMRTSLQASAT